VDPSSSKLVVEARKHKPPPPSSTATTTPSTAPTATTTSGTQKTEVTFEDSLDVMLSDEGTVMSNPLSLEGVTSAVIPPSPLTPRFLPQSSTALPRPTNTNTYADKYGLFSSMAMAGDVKQRFLPVSSLDGKPVALFFFMMGDPGGVELVEKMKNMYPFKSTASGTLHI
jgi:hypothetical protein